MASPSRRPASTLLLCAALGLMAARAEAFTQSGGSPVTRYVVPMGHEWLTSMAAREVLGDWKIPADDPRMGWKRGRAEFDLTKAEQELARINQGAWSWYKTDLRYSSGYLAVYSAVIGERWVDLGGMNVAKGQPQLSYYDCFDAAVQEPDENMYDHFMRGWNDHGPDGAIAALKGSRARFIKHFVDAARAPSGKLMVYDGGAASSAVEVDRNYFLFGRAVHLFQDSFSPEHTVRTDDGNDNYMTVRQIRGYLCAEGAEHHSFATPLMSDYKENGDVIWREDISNLSTYKAKNMKPVAQVALEGTKELWASFIRIMAKYPNDADARGNLAAKEAEKLANRWMGFSADEVRAWYNTPAHRGPTYLPPADATALGACVARLEGKFGATNAQAPADKLRHLQWRLKEHQMICLYNLKPKDAAHHPDFDPNLHLPYYWEWKNLKSWDTKVPVGWTPPAQIGDFH